MCNIQQSDVSILFHLSHFKFVFIAILQRKPMNIREHVFN